MLRIFKVIKELGLYREYLSEIKKQSLDSPEWGKLRLRRDWFGRIYTVVNLPPEVTQSPDFPKYARPSLYDTCSSIYIYSGTDLNVDISPDLHILSTKFIYVS